MASTRAELGLRMLGQCRKSRRPSGERARSSARTPRLKPPPPPLDPNPLEEEPVEVGAAGSRGVDPPLGALAPGATPRPSVGSPPERSRASVSAQDTCAAAMRALRTSIPAATAGGPRTPQALDTALAGTAKAPARSHAKEVFVAAVSSRSEGGKLYVVASPPSALRGAPNAATGAGDDVPAAGIAAVNGGADDIGPGATGTGAPSPGSSVGGTT
jgi:hypothetical protein